MEKLASKANNKKFFGILFAKRFNISEMEKFCQDKPNMTFSLVDDNLFKNISESNASKKLSQEIVAKRVIKMSEYFESICSFMIDCTLRKDKIIITLIY